MKKINALVFLLPALLLQSGCVVNIQDSITGDGKVIQQTRELPEFTGIKVASGIDVFLTQGEPQQVIVEADENLQEWIRTEVNGSVLHIYTEKTIRLAKTKKVSITCKTLDKLEASSAGDITGLTRFKTDKIDIDLSSAGDIRMDVDADEINLSLSSAGDADLRGSTRILKADLSSAGQLNAFDLQSKIAEITVSSAGNANVAVSEEASFNSSSAGNITYIGDPKIREIHTSSAGKVNKK